jgi:hypothetical protein
MLLENPDLQWMYPHTAQLMCQGIPQLLTFLESWVVEYLVDWEIPEANEFHKFLPMLRPVINNYDRKLFGSYNVVDRKYRPPRWLPGIQKQKLRRSSPWPTQLTNIIISFNVAELVNQAITMALSKPTSCRTGTSIEQSILKQELQELRYEPSKCHRKVLLVGSFSDQIGSVKTAPLAKFFNLRSENYDSTISHTTHRKGDIVGQARSNAL